MEKQEICFAWFFSEPVARDGAKGHGKKGREERKRDRALPWALVVPLAMIFGKHGERKQQLQGRKEKERGSLLGGRVP